MYVWYFPCISDVFSTHITIFRPLCALCVPPHQVSEAGVHRPHVAGIHGRENEGAYSIVLSGGYDDDKVRSSPNLCGRGLLCV